MWKSLGKRQSEHDKDIPEERRWFVEARELKDARSDTVRRLTVVDGPGVLILLLRIVCRRLFRLAMRWCLE